ncbi:MAG: bifunctional diaminohydroxyphosphoribosylaminopyrimidine deaminase/5-amino-6-(5-phosphoribosylamino)uracil reductase RibD [Acutalibacteraceae bacterium]
MQDKEYMKKALLLAKNGQGFVSPNPLVGAVVVKNGKIIGQGYHQKYGDLHAERKALESCIQSPQDATMYVTLEPCCHFGKTPPCCDAIINSGIKKVVVATLDPNPLTSGKGIKALKTAGIEVMVGTLERDSQAMNEVFFHYIKTKTPFVVMKYAMTADGKIATATGKSKWITGEKARENVHKDRSRYSAIMVGVQTVIADNPMLTSRIENAKNPVRIICDTSLRTPINSQIIKTSNNIKTIIATSSTNNELKEKFKNQGCKIIEIPQKNSHIDLQVLMQKLGQMQIDSILLEGGSTLNFSALNSEIVNKVQAYVSPKIFGGECAKTPVGGVGFLSPDKCIKLVDKTVEIFDDDILIQGQVSYECLQE